MTSTIMTQMPAGSQRQAATEETDETLVMRAREGDRDAFSLLMARYRGLVYAYAAARVLNRDEAEDLVQEALVCAYLALPQLRAGACWPAWLMRIVRNLCHDALRQRRVRRTEPLPEEWLDDRPSPEWQALAAEQRRLVCQAISTLPERLLTPLLMHYISGRTYAEIALALNVPHSTVVGRLAGALRHLRRYCGAERI
jgi:RNA polymerase sigma-70 factor (ECF subfamily)